MQNRRNWAAKAAGSSNVVGTSSKRIHDDSDSDTDENDTLTPKRKKPRPGTDSKSDTPPAVDITAYIHVL